jgi:crotonobetainyl-CoA:carnitine CoA-transferase CaiB-like acyl-CoA transferase
LGTEIIKAEKPVEGDLARAEQAVFGWPLILSDGRNLLRQLTNRNKKGIAVDLYSPKG